jgi:hypothetical protein
MKAIRVFGDTVADDVGGGSLNYSQSTNKTSTSGRPSGDDLETSKVSALDPLLGCAVPDRDDASRQSSGRFDTFVAEDKENREAIQTETTIVAASSNGISERRGVVSLLRQQTRSPLRRDLVRMTQEAINKASASVLNSLNPSVAAAREAAIASHRLKAKIAAKTRRDWEKDNAEAKTFNEQIEQNRREILALQRELSSKFSKEKAHEMLNQRHAFLQRVDKESQFNSAVFREHCAKQKAERDERRRKSIAARAKLRVNHRIGDQKLKLGRIAEERLIFEERHEASKAKQSFIQQAANERRKSFIFRNGDARRIRELHQKIEADRKRREQESFKLQQLAGQDAAEYQHQLAQQRRDSLAMRNAEARSLREREMEQHVKSKNEEHGSFEATWAAERDAQEYKKRLEHERRQSLARRNLEGRKQRELTQQQHSDQSLKAHEDMELKWAGEKDAEQYLRALEQDRRDSLAFRNKEGKGHRDFARDQQLAEIRARHESLELKWAGEQDANIYKQKVEEERRKSLAQRNKEARRQREQKQIEANKAFVREHESFELKRAAAKDVEKYKREQAEIRRKSLAHRNQEGVRHAVVMEELRRLAIEKETESYVAKWAGENDVHAYMARLAKEHRDSLQLRGKQSQRQRKIENEIRNEELNQMHEDEEMRAADHAEVAKYLDQCAERDRKSLEYRGKELCLQRIQGKEYHLSELELQEKNQKLESLARADVAEYVEDCKQRRRMSLAHRANEKRRHAQWQREQREKEIDEHSRLVHDRLRDQRHVELARQQERARVALNAIRHAGYPSCNSLSNLLS